LNDKFISIFYITILDLDVGQNDSFKTDQAKKELIQHLISVVRKFWMNAN